MLYGNESISHYSRTNVSIWMSMAFQGGILNMGGFMACHRFVSHVTGFAAYFGYEISRFEYKQALGMLLVPLFFLFGAMLSGQLVDIRLRLHLKPKYYISFGFMFFLLLCVCLGGALGYFGVFGEPANYIHDYVLLALLCLVCGVQNGTITSASKAVVRTTHLSGITTDLGIGLMRVFHRDQLGEEISGEVKANLMRIGIIFFFGLGSVFGAWIFSAFGYSGFLVPAITSGLLALLMWYFQAFRFSKKTI